MRQDLSFRGAGSGGVSMVFARLSNYDVLFFAAMLFLAPNILFAATALQPAPATLVLAGSAGVIAFLWRSRPGGVFLSTALDAHEFGLCLAIGFALCLLGGEGHFFYSNWDWLMRDAVLADLVRDGPVPLYRYVGQDYYLRAPPGMYLLPAAVGRILGLFAAHLTLLSTNAALIGAILYLVSGLAEGRALIFLAILIGFGGLDIVGDLAARIVFLRGGPISNQSLEWWASAFAPDVTLQYSSMLTQLFWVTNHAAPGWFIGLLVLLRGRDEITLSTLIVCCASLVIWSPFPVAGALPLAAALALQPSLRRHFTAENLLAVGVGLAFLPLALYLLTSVDTIAHRSQTSARGFAWIYIPFLLIELPQAAIILYRWPTVPASDRPALIAALGTLCFLPLYAFGPGNDLLMRGSIPALFIVAFSFARIAVSTPRDGGVLATAISSIILISAVTPVTQIKQAIFPGRYSPSDCNLLTAAQSMSPIGFPTNYLAPLEEMPRRLIAVDPRHAPAQVEYRDCWPDHPLRDLLRGDIPD
jgi:hypothetical protein